MTTPTSEERHRADHDPWQTTTDASELAKAQATLAACGPGRFAAACDLGAGLGVLSALLAPRCDALLALDGAPTAVAAAAWRLAPWPRAQAHVAVLPAGLPPGPFDLIIASEILCYLTAAELDAVARWLPGALTHGGRLVAVHWTGRAPELRQPAATVHARLIAVAELRLRRTHHERTYRLDVLERR